MKTSESITKFAPAFVKAQAAIRFAVKDSTNPAFKNKYADLGAVIEAVKAALNENGIGFIQLPTPSDDGKLHLTTRLMHDSGEWLESTMTMPLAKQDPQGLGSAMTYARRYCLAAVCGLYQDDDDANAASGVTSKPAATSSSPKPSTPAASAKPTTTAPPDNLSKLVAQGEIAAKCGLTAYKAFWEGLSVADKNAIGTSQHELWKKVASTAKVAV